MRPQIPVTTLSTKHPFPEQDEIGDELGKGFNTVVGSWVGLSVNEVAYRHWIKFSLLDSNSAPDASKIPSTKTSYLPFPTPQQMPSSYESKISNVYSPISRHFLSL